MLIKGKDSPYSINMESIPIEQRLNEQRGLSHHHATGIVQDKDGVIWISTWNGLNRYDGYTITTFKPHPGDGSPMGVDRIKDIHIRDYHIYCNVEGLCFIFNIRNGKFSDSHKTWEQVLKSFSLPTNVHKYLKGKDGTTWVVDSLGVLMNYKIPCYTKRLLWQPGCQVRALFRDHDGNIWVCSRDDHTVRIYDAKMHLTGFLGADGKIHPNKTAFVSSVYCIYQDSEDFLWLGCKPGGLLKLCKRTPHDYEIKHINNSQKEPYIGKEAYSICQDRWGRLWIGTMDAGLFCCPNPKVTRFLHIPLGKEISPQKYKSIRTVHITSQDILLIGTTQGLFSTKLSASNPNTYYYQLHEREGKRYGSLSNSSIMYTMEDKYKHIYICTEGGGVNFAEYGDSILSPHQNFHHFDKWEMPDDFISSAFEYGIYSWFIGTNNIMGLNNKHNSFLCFNHYTWHDSLLFSDAQPLLLGKGYWLFGLMDGLAVIDINQLLAKGFVPNIVLTNVLIENRESHDAVSAHDSIYLNEEQRNVRITFAALDYQNKESLTYRFQLDDGGWNNLESNNSVTLLNLSPGKHHLFLESKSLTSDWTGNVKEIIIYVKPTIWQTNTAKVLYILSSLFLLFSIYYVTKSIQQSRRKQNELLNSYLELLEKYDSEKQLNNLKGNENNERQTTGIARNEPSNVLTNKTKLLSEEEQVFMQNVLKYVEQHIEESDLNVIEFAETLGLSKSGLYRKLKNIVGITPKEFVVRARMNRAITMLESTTLPIKEIAYSCGYSDQNYFGKCFHSTYGVSPSEYRQKHRI